LIQNIPENYTRAFVLMLNSIGPGCLSSAEAEERCLQSDAIFRHLNDTWGSAMALLIRADSLAFGEKQFEKARRCYLDSLESFDRLNNNWGRALCLNGLSHVERQTGHLEESLRLGRQSLELLEALDNQERVVQIRQFLGEVAEELNDLDSARQYFSANQDHYLQRGETRIARQYQERLTLLGG
jgi:tetratricopeptide (TPR) repeat protein